MEITEAELQAVVRKIEQAAADYAAVMDVSYDEALRVMEARLRGDAAPIAVYWASVTPKARPAPESEAGLSGLP